jgi:hypothetical protein
MVKRSTWILLAILALVIGAYFLLKNRPMKPGQATPTALGNTFLVTKSDGVLQSLQINDAQNHTVRMQRDPNGIWVITAPTTGEADQSLASAAETQVGALRIVTMLETTPELGAIQLAKPAYIIELTFNSGTQHKIEVGGLTPTSSGYYVRYDSKNIYVVSQDGIDALLNLLKAPPYPPTETPAPTDIPLTTTPETITPTP